MIQNIKTFIKQILLSGLSGLLICGQIAYGQSLTPIPQPIQQYFDANGNPLAGGSVTTFVPNTSNKTNTWQDINASVLNSNPVILDGAGRAKIFGIGNFREQVKDSLGNLIYDYVTNSPNPGGATVATTGDGDLPGTIKPWAGLTAPIQYQFAFGQALVRADFPALLAAITQTINVNCTSGSPILTGISDTTQIPNGAAVEAACIPPGSTVSSKTSSTVTINFNASATTTVSAIFFPFGNGNGSTTFNVPDLRGNVIAGRTNMGGIASTNLTSMGFISNPQASGAIGGVQTVTLQTANLPAYTPSGSVPITDPGHSHAQQSNTYINTPGSSAPIAGGALLATGGTTQSASTGITASFSGSAQGGTSTPFGIVQPTITLNYIIKTLPDTAATLFGVPLLAGDNVWTGANTFSPTSGSAAIIITTPNPSNTQGINIAQTTPNTGSQGSTQINLNQIVVNDGNNLTGGAASTGLFVQQLLNTNIDGQKYALFVASNKISAPTATSGDQIGIVSFVQTSVSNGGTNTGSGSSGSLYGINPIVSAVAGSGSNHPTNYTIWSGAEFDMATTDGSTQFRFGISIVNAGTIQAASSDSYIELSSVNDLGAFRNMIEFTDNRAAGTTKYMDPAGSLIADDGLFTTQSVTGGINLPNWTFTGNFLKAKNIQLAGTGFLKLGSGTSDGNSGVIIQGAITSGGVAGLISQVNGTSGFDGFHTSNSTATADLFMTVGESSSTQSVFGQVNANYAAIISSIGNGYLFGTIVATPMIIGTNNIQRMRIGAGSGISIGPTQENPNVGLLINRNANAASALSFLGGRELMLIGPDAGLNAFGMIAFGSQNTIVQQTVGGTAASPTAVTAGSPIFNMSAQAFTSAAIFGGNSIAIVGISTDNYTNTAQGAKLAISTTKSGTTINATAFELGGDQHLAIGNVAPTSVSTCGTGIITGNSTDTSGQVTATGATACTVNFATAFQSAPNCVVSDNTTAAALKVTTVVGSLTVSGLTSSDVFSYICLAKTSGVK